MDKVFTNVSANPVILSDGSSVAPGEQTSPGQYELARGSFWAEHGVLVSGAPVLAPSDSQQLSDLLADNESLSRQLGQAITLGHDKDAAQAQLNAQLQAQGETLEALRNELQAEQASSVTLGGELETLRKDLATEKAKVQKLETDLKAAQAKAK